MSDPPKPPGAPSDDPDPDAPVPIEEPPPPIPVPPNPPPEPMRTSAASPTSPSPRGRGQWEEARYPRFTFQNSGPLYSSFPTRLFRYAVGIWNWPKVIVAASE